MSAHAHSRHRRCRIHRFGLRPQPPVRPVPGAGGCAGHSARQAHLRRQPGQSGVRSPTPTATPSCRATSATPTVVAELIKATDAVVHFAAESHVDRSIFGGADFVLTNVLGTQTLLQAVAGREPHQVRPRLHRRGLRLDQRGLLDRGVAAAAELAVLGVEGLVGPGRPGLRQDPQAAGLHHPLLEQLRPLPVPREGHPAVRDQPDRRRVGAALRRRPNIRDWLHVDDHCRGIALVLARRPPR